jgi:hypothetical protein
MKNTLLLILVIFTIRLCAQQPAKAYVLSEGGFQTGTSKLGLLNLTDNSFSANIFSPGQLGPYPDGLLIYNNYLYIVEQGNYGASGKIYKLDTNGTVLNSASVGTNPYSLAISNGKIYITNGATSKVSVLNLSDFSAVTEISVGVYPQEIVACKNKIFVANTSLYGGASDSTVSVIDPLQDKVVATLTVRKDPSSLAVSNDGYLLIGCPGDAAYSRIYKVDPVTYAISNSYTIPDYGFGKEIAVDKSGNDIYFIANSNDVVKYTMTTGSAKVIVPSVFPANSYYGYTFDPVSHTHYVLDAKSYTVNGALAIYDSTGQVKQTFTTGIAPRRIVLKYSSTAAGVSESIRTLTQYSLLQNYPNPFNPSTTISWESATRGQVVLRVLDILGNEIKILQNGEMAAGSHKVQFDASGLSSGIFYYQLTAPGFSATKKMILIK